METEIKKILGEIPPYVSKLKASVNNNQIFAKIETNYPTGSIKDLAVAGMLTPYISELQNLHFVMSSSGNAGIALARLGQQLNFKSTIFVPSNLELQKELIYKKLNSQIVKCDSTLPSDKKGGWVFESSEFCNQDPKHRILLNQFSNQKNVEAHYTITGKNLLHYFKTNNLNLDYIFLGVGSGGTAMGIAKYFHKFSPNTKIVIIEPIGGILHGYFHGKPTQYVDHQVDAISDCFVPENIDFSLISDVHQHPDNSFKEVCNDLFIKEGLFAGHASGFVLGGMNKYLNKLKISNKNIAFLITDNGYRYL